MTIPSPLYADPFATDPELLAWLRDTVQDVLRTPSDGTEAHLHRLEWFIRERIAAGIVAGTTKARIEGAKAMQLAAANQADGWWTLPFDPMSIDTPAGLATCNATPIAQTIREISLDAVVPQAYL